MLNDQIWIELLYAPTDDFKSLGPFDWIQITYNSLKVKREESPDEEELIFLDSDGLWVLMKDCSRWTDLIFSTSEPR